MNKTELNAKIREIKRCLKHITLDTKDVDTYIISGIKSILPDAKVEIYIEKIENTDKLQEIMLFISINELYRGRCIAKDIVAQRVNMVELEKLHKGIEMELIIDRLKSTLIVNICADYTLKNGYKEVCDIVPILNDTF